MRLWIVCFLMIGALSACGGVQDLAPIRHYGFGDKGGGANTTGIHTVKDGETLYEVASTYGLATQDLTRVNALTPPFALTAGQRLFLPAPHTYTVKEGDTLYRVARVTGVGESTIVSLNALQSPYALRPGHVLRLPSLAQDVSIGAGSNAAPSLAAVPLDVVEVLDSRSPSNSVSFPVGGVDANFINPLAQGRIIGHFGPQADGVHNDGINIAADKDTTVLAAQEGRVAYVGNALSGLGNLVLVRHDGGWVTAYAHLDHIDVQEGQALVRGQSLGTVGSSGNVNSPQLHFEIRRGTQAIDPAPYL